MFTYMYIYLHIIYVHFPRSMFTRRLHKHTPQITSNPCECECCGHSVEPMQCLASSVGWSRLWPGSISARSVMLRVAGATCGKAPRLSSGCLTSGMRLQTFGWSRLGQGYRRWYSSHGLLLQAQQHFGWSRLWQGYRFV